MTNDTSRIQYLLQWNYHNWYFDTEEEQSDFAKYWRLKKVMVLKDCDCPCHQKGVAMLHFMPCCDNNGKVKTMSWE